MAAPKGNQNALGNLGGRPESYDRKEMAIKLLEWALKEDSTNLNGFCACQRPPLSPSWVSRWAKESVEFLQAFEAAKAILGDRRERLLSQNLLHVKAYDLNAKVYDHFLKEEYRDQQAYEASLTSKDNNADEKDVSKLNAAMMLIDQLQGLSKSDRKIEDTNNIKDNKS